MYRILCALLLIISLAVTPGFAQETINNASLTGRVVDSSGAVVANATVTVRAVATDVATTASTDGAGRFHFAYLQVGQYEVVCHNVGFSDAKRGLRSSYHPYRGHYAKRRRECCCPRAGNRPQPDR